MDKLIEDSKYIQSLIEENKDEDIVEDYILEYFPNVDFDLLIRYYNDDVIENRDLLKIAEDMNLLDCNQLEDVLIKIKHSSPKVDYSSLNSDLIREIDIGLERFTQIACGHYHSVGLRWNYCNLG